MENEEEKRDWKITLPVKKLVRSPNELKAALYQEYNERLRRGEVRPDLKDQKKMDFELVKLKVKQSRLNKKKLFIDWTRGGIT